ncbi:MAG: response regulator, partial [Longimicrobiales bacterium]
SYLRDEGFDVIEAAHANEAICVLEHLAVDAVFSDIEMPGSLDGLALGQWVRRRKPSVGFLLTSGVEQTAAEGTEWELLSKPYEPSELTDRLRSLLGR